MRCAEAFLDMARDGFAVVIVDLKPKCLRAARNGLSDTSHTDNAETFSRKAASHHPSRRPPIKLAIGHQLNALM